MFEEKFLAIRNLKSLGLLALIALPAIQPFAFAGDNPAGNPASQVVVNTDQDPDELRSSDLNTAIRGFHAVKVGSDPESRLQLYGLIFKDCAGFFNFEPQKAGEYAGFRVTDHGGAGRECMKQHQGTRCDSTNVCVSLSQDLAGSTSIYLPGFTRGKDARLGLMFSHMDQDTANHTRSDWEAFPEGEMAYKSQATMIAEKGDRAREARDAAIRRLQNQVSSCTKTSDDREIALGAARALRALGELSYDDVAVLEKKARKKDLDDALANFKKISSKKPEELKAAAEELRALADEVGDPKISNAIAIEFHYKAQSISKGARKLETLDAADELIASAKDLSKLPEKATKGLERDELGLKVTRVQLMARTQSDDPGSFVQPYSELMQDLGSQVNECVGAAAYSDSSSSDYTDCNYAVKAYQSASQIPMIAQQSAYERYLFQIRQQQMMMQSFANPMMGGMYNMGGAFGAGGAMNMYGVNPMMNLGGGYGNFFGN